MSSPPTAFMPAFSAHHTDGGNAGRRRHEPNKGTENGLLICQPSAGIGQTTRWRNVHGVRSMADRDNLLQQSPRCVHEADKTRAAASRKKRRPRLNVFCPAWSSAARSGEMFCLICPLFIFERSEELQGQGRREAGGADRRRRASCDERAVIDAEGSIDLATPPSGCQLSVDQG